MKNTEKSLTDVFGKSATGKSISVNLNLDETGNPKGGISLPKIQEYPEHQ